MDEKDSQIRETMTKKSKKEKQVRKRKEALKRKKAKARALPKILRDEALLEALNTRHPLVECLINEEWQEEKVASILVIRDGSGGLVFANYLVDLAQRGLKDAWGNFGASRSDIELIKSKSSRAGFPLVPCDQNLAEKIVHGGIAWARKWGYKLPRECQVWTRLLAPPPPSEIDLGLFGVEGKPLYPSADLDQDVLDEELLSDDLQVSEEGFTKEALARIGDIKHALVRFAKSLEFTDEMNLAFEKRRGEPNPPDSEEDWIDFFDWFILEYELKEGGTIADLFLEHYEEIMSKDVRELVLGWQNVIEGLFEVKGVSGYAIDMKNLLNEREYRVFSTALRDDHGFRPGDFLYARVVPVMGFHLFSGNVRLLQGDGSSGEAFRAKVYREAMEMQARNPRLAFIDNPEKLQKSRDTVRKYHDAFVRHFGANEMIGTGKSILLQYRGFFEYLARNLRDPNKEDGVSPYSPEVELPDEVLASDDVGMLCDPVEGIFFLIDYGRFIDVFRSPEQHMGKAKAEELVAEYLTSDSISDVPLRRMAERFPLNFKRVIEQFQDEEGSYPTDIEDLMWEFKPWTFKKLPRIVTVLDGRMASLAKRAEQKPTSLVSRVKRWFS